MNDPRDMDPELTAEETAGGEPEQEQESAGTDEVIPVEEAPPEPELSAEELLAAERDDMKERWLRSAAELDNVRKRARRDVADARRFAQADVLRSLLDVADNFERALGSMAGDDEATADSVREGVDLIHQRFLAVLRDRGVELIEALDTEFDPNCHEALGQAPREDTDPGLVIEVVQQGYRFGDMVLRPARVIISS